MSWKTLENRNEQAENEQWQSEKKIVLTPGIHRSSLQSSFETPTRLDLKKVARVGWRRGVTVAMVIKWRPYVQKWCSP